MRAALFSLFLALLGLPATAQTIQQSGQVTPNHVGCWITTGVLGDCGTSTNGKANSFGLTFDGGIPFGISTGNQSNPAHGLLYMDASSTGGGALNWFGSNSGVDTGFTVGVNGKGSLQITDNQLLFNGLPLPIQADVSSATVTATGSTTARTLATRTADVINLLDWGVAIGNSGTVNTADAQRAVTFACSRSAASSNGSVLYLPAGQYYFDTTTVPFNINCAGVSFRGAGAESTTVFPTGAANFIAYTQPPQQAFGGYAKISEFRIYRTDSSATSRNILLSHVSNIYLDDIEIGGGFRDVEVIGSVNVFGANVALDGDDTASGSVNLNLGQNFFNINTSVSVPSGNTLTFSSTASPQQVYLNDYVTGTNIPANTVVTGFTATAVTLNNNISGTIGSGSTISFSDQNNSGVLLTNLTAGSSNSYSYAHALLVGNVDGLWITGGHLGFTAAEAALILPAGTTSAVDNIHFTGTDFDTSSYGLRFTALGGYAGNVNAIFVSGGLCELMSSDCIRVDDPSVRALSVTGMSFVRNADYGVNIQGGNNISVVGGTFQQGNTSGMSFSHILVGGTASSVDINGVSFSCNYSPCQYDNIAVQDSADYVNISGSSFNGATNLDIDNTSSGSHINAGTGISDIALGNFVSGMNAMSKRTTGQSNTAFGAGASAALTTQSSTSAFGTSALLNNTGGSNTAVGAFAGQFVGSGGAQVAVGASALQGSNSALLTGTGNVAIGTNALQKAQGTATNNSALGFAGAPNLTTGVGNVGLGYDTLPSVTTGSGNIAIGAAVDTPSASNVSNTLNIGNAITATGLNGTTAVTVNGSLTSASYIAGASVGVSCSGSPTSSFASVNGIVTHC